MKFEDTRAWLLPLTIVGTVVLAGAAMLRADRDLREGRARYRALHVELAREALVTEGGLWVHRAGAKGDLADPLSPGWEAVPPRIVPLSPQSLAMPASSDLAVSEVDVRSAVRGDRIFWRVAWRDATRDDVIDTGRFTDAVAVQFPVDRPASFMMGDASNLVQILHWKAVWQHDVDERFLDVQDVHPNYWVDLYWFAEGERPYRVPDAFQNPASLEWFPAHEAGNPVSAFERETPVEECAAFGYGSLTTHVHSAASGRGVWRDGTWTVVFQRPLRTDDPLDFQFVEGGRGRVGVAVWDGSSGQVGGRKQYANWVDFEVEPET